MTSPSVSNDDHCAGALIGAAVGDSLGSYLEFKKATECDKRKVAKALTMPGGGPFNVLSGQITDDTELAFSQAWGILKDPSCIRESVNLDNIANQYAVWGGSHPFDIGSTCSKAFRVPWSRDQRKKGVTAKEMIKVATGNKKSKSNGALMRATPLAMAFWPLVTSDLPRLATIAAADARLSHPSCAAANAAYVCLVASLIQSGTGPGAQDLAARASRALGHASDALAFLVSAKKVPSADADEVMEWTASAAAEGAPHPLGTPHVGWMKHAWCMTVTTIVLLQVPGIDFTKNVTAILYLISLFLASRSLLRLGRTTCSTLVCALTYAVLCILPYLVIGTNIARVIFISMPGKVSSGESGSIIRMLFTLILALPMLPMLLSVVLKTDQPRKDPNKLSTITRRAVLSGFLIFMTIVVFLALVMPVVGYPIVLDLLFSNILAGLAQTAIPLSFAIALFARPRLFGRIAFALAVAVQYAWHADVEAAVGINVDIANLPISGFGVSSLDLNTRLFGPLTTGVTFQEDLVWWTGTKQGREVTLTTDVYIPAHPNGAVFATSHWGSWAMGSKGYLNMPWFSAMLAERGYLVIDYNYGLMPVSPEGPMGEVPTHPMWDDRVWNECIDECAHDNELFMDWLEAQIAEDTWALPGEPTIFFNGGSAGASNSVFMGQRYPDRVGGVIVESLCINIDPDDHLHLQDDHYKPLLFSDETVHPGQVPTLQIHGTKDPLCDPRVSLDSFGPKVKAAGVPYGSVEVSTGSHLLTIDTSMAALVWLELVDQFMTSIHA
eukprot:gnl/Dysnectes_brevis/879_a974_1906.p1 GENE.gnl/Dysnectes_brevis/879_a974_1906~~gnl/Dysnectes_brevis/879_a974_1906.p1  ORF type:complete len:780 (-),score=292.91 gnl/Dysnectes_brevis/879_a974_1906:321-2660(-)